MISRRLCLKQDLYKKYIQSLLQNKVLLKDLVFTNRITLGVNQHKNRTIQADTVNQLKFAGKLIKPGQKIRYIINDYSRKISKRVIPVETIDSDNYDAKRYSELLEKYCKSIMEPFE